jgi:large subunit ribosomal protein L29
MNKEKIELKQMSAEQLREKVEAYRHELLSLRLTAATSHVKDFSQFKKLRKNIARVLTLLQEKSKSN